MNPDSDCQKPLISVHYINTWSRRDHVPHNPATSAKVSRSRVARESHEWPGNFGTSGRIMWSMVPTGPCIHNPSKLRPTVYSNTDLVIHSFVFFLKNFVQKKLENTIENLRNCSSIFNNAIFNNVVLKLFRPLKICETAAAIANWICSDLSVSRSKKLSEKKRIFKQSHLELGFA